MEFDKPLVMGIVNVTPDSFFEKSRVEEVEKIRSRIISMISEGVDIIDVGGCSTRPGFSTPTMEEEWRRVDLGCRIVRELSSEIPLSIDTFRAEIAGRALEVYDADIINDVSGGKDVEMFATVAKHRVAYILTHNLIDSQDYSDVTANVITWLAKKLDVIHRLGVNDVIVDPGFGFAKNVEENFQLFRELEEVASMGYPLLVGISRKSMIWKSLGITPEESLTGTIALNAIALEKGADILRVHDVKEAVEIVKLFEKLHS